jgi:hypothetical protein
MNSGQRSESRGAAWQQAFTCRCVVVACLLLVASPGIAAEKPDAAAVAPFVERDTIAVVHVDLSRVYFAPLKSLVNVISPDSSKEVSLFEAEASDRIAQLRRAGLKDVFGVVSLGGRSLFPHALLAVPDAARVDRTAVAAALGLQANDSCRQVGDGLAIVAPAPCQPGDIHSANRPELADALKEAGDAPIRIAIIPPDSSRRVIEELMPQLPEQVGGGASTIITHGIRWAAIAVDASPSLSIRIRIKAQDSAAAEALRTKWLDALKFAGRNSDVRRAFPQFNQLSALLTPKLSGDRLTLVLDEKAVVASGALAPLQGAVASARDSAKRAQSMNNLKQLALAMYGYYESGAKHFPSPASRTPDGKPLLSWRVAILPYIDRADLYKQFHLDEPWDSPHNKKLIEKMPAVFKSPRSKASDGRTGYLVPVGGGALYSSIADEPQIKDITDGTSHTIMIVEVDDLHSVIWTKPDDLTFEPGEPKKGLGKQILAAFCDGSCQIIPGAVDDKALKALFTRAAGDRYYGPF